MKKQTNKTIFISIVFILITGVVIVSMVYLWPSAEDTQGVKTTQKITADGWLSASSTQKDGLAVYMNDRFSFRFAYPQFYSTSSDTRISGSNNGLLLRDALVAQNYPKITVSVYEMSKYRFSKGSGASPVYYDSNTNSWERRLGAETKTISKEPTMDMEGLPVYKFTGAVIPGRWDAYAIPLKGKNKMIEIRFSYDTIKEESDYTSKDVDQVEIIETFQRREKSESQDSSRPKRAAKPRSNKQKSHDSIAASSATPVTLDVPENAFGGKRVFTSISRLSYSQVANTSQPNLRPVSAVVKVDTNKHKFQKDARISFLITDMQQADRLNDLGIYHKKEGEQFRKITSKTTGKRAEASITEPGVYAVLGER